MTTNEPKLSLIEMSPGEWRFTSSEQQQLEDEQFRALLENHFGTKKFTHVLRTFILDNPDHLEAFHYLALHKLETDRPIDAMAYAHTAVAIGERAFTTEFVAKRGTLPTGWVQNRPFLRAKYGLMLAQKKIGLEEQAIRTGEECLHLDGPATG